MSKKVRRMLLIFTLGMIAICFLQNKARKAEASASAYIQSLKEGINLGNTYETGVEETKITNPVVAKKIVEHLKMQGYGTIRIPITVNGHFDKETGIIEESYYKEIEVMVDAAVNANLNVILTMYGDSYQWLNNMNNQKETMNRYQKVWKQIALHYKTYSKKLSFEGANAPYYDNKKQSEQLKRLNNMNQAFVKAVRSTGANNTHRTLFISTLNGAVTEEICNSMADAYKKLADEDVAVSVHYYGLWSFSVNACGKTAFDADVKNDIATAVSLLKNTFMSKNIPVVCTEYGLYGQETENQSINTGEKLKYYEEFLYQTKLAKLPIIFWENGNLYNKEEGTWYDEALRKLFVAARKGRSSYTDTDSIYLRKGSLIKDKALSLTLHGNKLKYIKANGKILSPNQDYQLKGKKLTIKAEYLENVVQQHMADFGEYEVLTLQFTHGAPFYIHIYGYRSAVLSSSAGTVEEFAIPSAFNGDRLVGMEAFNTSKQARGPITDSTYQEYGNSFEPEYEKGMIRLTKAFLSSLKEEQTILQFHFASGETKKYTIKRENEIIKEVNYKSTLALPSPVASEPPAATQSPSPTIASTQSPKEQSVAVMKPVKEEKKDTKGIVYSIIMSIIILLLFIYSLYFLRKRGMQKKQIEKEGAEKSTGRSIDK